MRTLLGREASVVAAASMERRPGPKYAFCEPLLESVLRIPQWCQHPLVIVALLFLGPGKHAGAGGDIAQIIAEAAAVATGLGQSPLVLTTDLVGGHPLLLDVLVDRYKGAVSRRLVVPLESQL